MRIILFQIAYSGTMMPTRYFERNIKKVIKIFEKRHGVKNTEHCMKELRAAWKDNISFEWWWDNGDRIEIIFNYTKINKHD